MAHAENDARYRRTLERKALVLELVGAGVSVLDALNDPRIGVSYSAYRKWRERDPKWSAMIDVARASTETVRASNLHQMSSAQFCARYFNRVRAPFQQQAIDAIKNCLPGNMVLLLFPPEHGKTTTFEDHATEMVVRDPQWRSTVASENQSIAKKIVGRVRGRLEPDGPCPNLVKEWGPFRPDAARSGGSNFYQPWNDTYFNVRLKKTGDERDYNMFAIGVDSSTVSIRTDQLHIDDPQSQKTIHRTPKLLNWFRSDGLTRPGEHGRTSIAMTRAGEDDFASALEDDEELADMLTVVKFRAIVKNPLTGEDEPLWPARYSLDSLDRIRRKIKDDAFERNYMMTSGVQRNKFGFSDEGRLRALDESRRLGQLDGWGDRRPPLVLSLDPGLAPGLCCLQGWALTAEAMHLVDEDERADFVRNEEIIDMIDRVCAKLERGYRVAHLVVEAANFQRGLARDERLQALKRRYGFTMAEHQTNANKYDDDIGVASMAGDWEAGKIRLPYDPTDRRTRDEIDELCKQLRRWKPLIRGNRQRMDRVMAMWFAWIYWQQQRTMLGQETVQWRRTGIPWAQQADKPQLIIPIGVTV